MSLGGAHTQALVLMGAIVCGLAVYMAIDLRKKLNLVDIVLDKINKAALQAVTKDDLRALQAAASQPAPAAAAVADPPDTQPPVAPVESDSGRPLSPPDLQEMVVLPMPPAKRARK